MVKRLSTWLRSGVVDKNIKDNFRSTLNALYDTCPLKISRRALRDSLHDNLYNDQVFRQESPANITVFGWFEDQRLSKLSSPSSKQPKQPKQKRACAVFKKTRLYSSNVTTNNVDNQINNNYINDKTIRRDSSPSLRQKFSFTDSEQVAFVEHIINLAEKAIYKFLVDNECNIPLNVVMDFVSKQRPPVNIDFSNADLLCMLNFIIDNINIFIRVSAFHGRWNDHSLQNVAILACEIIICVGGNHEDICAYKENVDNEIVRRWINSAVKNCPQLPQKRKHGDVDDASILEEVEESKKGEKQDILKLALKGNEQIIQFCKGIKMKEKDSQIRKFIQFANLMFDIDLKVRNKKILKIEK
ncbi:hypothetical protein RhiirA5_421535 [Rhizophagus irregularis]|uniref:Uncharacterized protein n=1 Tax=Rhizophagus irregularis TaxID=588596 RepID=A0A2I1F282_9GLOM|nr:hypothetical protein RhiirA5_421535 [Rhizophagus irregularis]PKC55038.1 hypothetical protein RhiirA1_476263 [Rhizophagus irregularis]PKY28483.1 hypothetical protein RhiirB3_444671 [Rhizophagus irregularis]CAB4483686.1 unnamed protein product [Rhizophagus irregularis]CAB5209014.1 unnamed protein product [Rhizophagus irregularis]